MPPVLDWLLYDRLLGRNLLPIALVGVNGNDHAVFRLLKDPITFYLALTHVKLPNVIYVVVS